MWMKETGWLSGALILLVVTERSLFWQVSKRLPSFRHPVYLGVLVLHFLSVARKTGLAYVGRGGRELVRKNVMVLGTMTVVQGGLAILAAGGTGEGWRSVLLMHASSIVDLIDATLAKNNKSVWTTPALLFLTIGSYAVVVSDKTAMPGAVYATAWIIHGIGGRIRRRVMADEQLVSFACRESVVSLLIGILTGPLHVFMNKFFRINKHAPDPVNEYLIVMTQFPRCMTHQVPFLIADQCGWESGVLVFVWWVSHFACAGVLLKLATLRHPLDVAMTHTAGLLTATILLFSRMHAEDEVLAALTVVVGLLCAHAAAEGEREEGPSENEAEAPLVENT
jgi:hypothetical protein